MRNCEKLNTHKKRRKKARGNLWIMELGTHSVRSVARKKNTHPHRKSFPSLRINEHNDDKTMQRNKQQKSIFDARFHLPLLVLLVVYDRRIHTWMHIIGLRSCISHVELWIWIKCAELKVYSLLSLFLLDLAVSLFVRAISIRLSISSFVVIICSKRV